LSENDEAKAFLQGFLIQLARSDQTNRELLQTNRELLQANRDLINSQSLVFHQNNEIIQALSTMSAQIGELARRSAYLHDQMGRLGQILVNDGSALPAESFPSQIGSVARDLGRGVMDGFVRSFQGGYQGGSGSPRRR
jgi:hypothetical protein